MTTTDERPTTITHRPWCQDHLDGFDSPGHCGIVGDLVTLTTQPLDQDGDPVTLRATLWHDPEDGFCVELEDGEAQTVELTIAEAFQLARSLLALCEAAVEDGARASVEVQR
jgi:hypothetical protein